jgi:TPR repeat protein
MKRIMWIVVSFAVGSVCQAQQYEQKAISGSQGMALSDQQTQTYSQQALEGGGDAASRLGMYYLAVQGDRKRSEYWYRISAENGDVGAQRTYGTMLLQDSSENKARAIFWLKKSADSGDTLAKKTLQKLQN